MKKTLDTTPFIPLRPSAFSVLAVLSHGAKPGIDILDHIQDTLPGSAIFGGGTLYRLLRDMREEGLIERSGPEHADKRHVTHSLTPLGEAVLREESARLERTLRLANGAKVRAKR